MFLGTKSLNEKLRQTAETPQFVPRACDAKINSFMMQKNAQKEDYKKKIDIQAICNSDSDDLALEYDKTHSKGKL